MIKAQVRFPVVVEKNGKKKQKLGDPTVMEFTNRAEMAQYMDGILKNCRVKLLRPDTPATKLKNNMMQHICGVA